MPTLAGINRRVFGIHRKPTPIDVQGPPPAEEFEEAARAQGASLGALLRPRQDALEVVNVQTLGNRLIGPGGRAYTLGKPLGSGSFGDVTTLRYEGTDKLRAAKKIVSRTARADAAREAEAARIAHSPIAPELILNAERGFLEETVYLVLPLMSADLSPVEKMLAGYSMAEREDYVLSFASQLLQQVQWLHEAEWAHQDIKDENILRRGPSVFLADFGGARSVETLRKDARERVFTPRFLPPEAVSELTKGKPSKHPTAADIWALGIVLMTCLGGYPFEKYGDLPDAHRDWKRWERTGFRSGKLQPALQTLQSASQPTRKLLADMLDSNPRTRLTAFEALRRVEKQRAQRRSGVDLQGLFAADDTARGAQLAIAAAPGPFARTATAAAQVAVAVGLRRFPRGAAACALVAVLVLLGAVVARSYQASNAR